MGRRFFVLIVACSCARTGLYEEPASAIAACKAGDPPLVLASTTSPRTPLALATDGAWLYVVQREAPALWSVSTSGGAVASLDDLAVSDPVAWQDGVYVDVASSESAHGGAWIQHDGVARRQVFGGMFAPPLVLDSEGTLDGVVNGGNFGGQTVYAHSIENGAATVSFAIPFWHEASALSTHFAHCIGRLEGRWTDGRFDWTTGARRDEIDLALDDKTAATVTPHVTAGPSGMCVHNTCILDDAVSTLVVDLDPDGVLALDDDFAYGKSGGQLARISLRDGHHELLAAVEPRAVAVANGCVYVATANDVLRVAPSE